MKITEDLREYAAEQRVRKEEALKRGIETKSKESTPKGTEFYAKAWL